MENKGERLIVFSIFFLCCKLNKSFEIKDSKESGVILKEVVYNSVEYLVVCNKWMKII